MNIDFKGYNENIITLKADSTLPEGTKGVAVTLSGQGTATLAPENSFVLGVCLSVRNGYASVQTTGYARVKTTGNLTPGCRAILSDGKGGVKASDSGKLHFVLDSIDGEAGILF
ncbi:MAG: hypothetical protein ACI4HM_00145 [Ruminococcus sp.]